MWALLKTDLLNYMVFEKIHVFVCLFFILLYIDSTACVDLMYFCLFDMTMFLWLV